MVSEKLNTVKKKIFTRKWFEQRLRRNAIRAQQNLDEVARQLEHMKFKRNYHRSNKNYNAFLLEIKK